MATLIKANGTCKKVFPKDKENGFTLNELYNLIECSCIEIAKYFDDGKMMVVDEEGRLKENQQINHIATCMCECLIVGNAIVCNDKELK